MTKITLTYPYRMNMESKEEARNIILNMCSNCERKIICEGSESARCNEIKDTIVQVFNDEEHERTLEIGRYFTKSL